MKPTIRRIAAYVTAFALASCATTVDPVTKVQTTKPDGVTVSALIGLARDIFVKAPVATEVKEGK